MKSRRICTRVDNLDSSQKKELRTRINKTVEDYNQEQESQNGDDE